MAARSPPSPPQPGLLFRLAPCDEDVPTVGVWHDGTCYPDAEAFFNRIRAERARRHLVGGEPLDDDRMRFSDRGSSFTAEDVFRFLRAHRHREDTDDEDDEDDDRKTLADLSPACYFDTPVRDRDCDGQVDGVLFDTIPDGQGLCYQRRCLFGAAMRDTLLRENRDDMGRDLTRDDAGREYLRAFREVYEANVPMRRAYEDVVMEQAPPADDALRARLAQDKAARRAREDAVARDDTRQREAMTVLQGLVADEDAKHDPEAALRAFENHVTAYEDVYTSTVSPTPDVDHWVPVWLLLQQLRQFVIARPPDPDPVLRALVWLLQTVSPKVPFARHADDPEAYGPLAADAHGRRVKETILAFRFDPTVFAGSFRTNMLALLKTTVPEFGAMFEDTEEEKKDNDKDDDGSSIVFARHAAQLRARARSLAERERALQQPHDHAHHGDEQWLARATVRHYETLRATWLDTARAHAEMDLAILDRVPHAQFREVFEALHPSTTRGHRPGLLDALHRNGEPVASASFLRSILDPYLVALVDGILLADGDSDAFLRDAVQHGESDGTDPWTHAVVLLHALGDDAKATTATAKRLVLNFERVLPDERECHINVAHVSKKHPNERGKEWISSLKAAAGMDRSLPQPIQNYLDTMSKRIPGEFVSSAPAVVIRRLRADAWPILWPSLQKSAQDALLRNSVLMRKLLVDDLLFHSLSPKPEIQFKTARNFFETVRPIPEDSLYHDFLSAAWFGNGESLHESRQARAKAYFETTVWHTLQYVFLFGARLPKRRVQRIWANALRVPSVTQATQKQAWKILLDIAAEGPKDPLRLAIQSLMDAKALPRLWYVFVDRLVVDRAWLAAVVPSFAEDVLTQYVETETLEASLRLALANQDAARVARVLRERKEERARVRE